MNSTCILDYLKVLPRDVKSLSTFGSVIATPAENHKVPCTTDPAIEPGENGTPAFSLAHQAVPQQGMPHVMLCMVAFSILGHGVFVFLASPFALVSSYQGAP